VSAVVQLISNPSAGRHKARRIAALARAFEALGATVHATPCGAGPPPIGDDTTHVCVAAGDGTVRHVAGAIARSGHDVALSIYPLGTINLLAMEAGYPRRPADFARAVLAAEPSRRHYPVTIGDGYFFACAGVGPDSLAVARMSSGLKRAIGRLAYGAAFLGLVVKWPRHRIELTLGERTLECEAFYVAKGRYYAGRWSFAREARVHDPVLHVVALTIARRRDYARFVWTLLRHGEPGRLPNVEILTCTTLHAASAEPLPVQADGDIVCTLPVTLTVAETPLLFC
jgi:diacylglycerol kinase family enzyme